MHYDPEPVAGNWYHYPDKAQKFKVLDVDEESGDIELQYFDGTIDQIDFYIWGSLGAERVEEPEDWTGPMDNIESGDLDQTIEMDRRDWAAPYDENLEKNKAGPQDRPL